MFFVHHDQPDIGEWRGQRRSRPHDHVHLSGANPTPLVGPLALAQAGMENGDFRVQVRSQTIHQRHGQRDLRNENERGSPGRDHFGDSLRVDRGLA